LDRRDENSNGFSAGNETPSNSWEYVEYHRLPSFLHDNEFLRRRHRPQLNSVIKCLKSAFMLHSETWNIWTHVFGICINNIYSNNKTTIYKVQ